jgi:hypothetical protein
MSSILDEIKVILERSAVIVHGNSKYEHKAIKHNTYDEIEKALKQAGINKVYHDPGKEFTEPRKADVWVGFSKGGDRLRFGDKSVLKISINDTASEHSVVNPDDKLTCDIGKPNCNPAKSHFIITDEMKNKLISLIKK